MKESDAPSEFEAFNQTMDKLLSVSHKEMQRRIAAYKKEAAKNPNKRGPKPKKRS
jgi:hypothetical protein